MSTRVSGEYPPEWPALSLGLKQGAGWRCERCGHPDDPALRTLMGVRPGRLPCDGRCTHATDGKQRMLTVHHLDGNKANLERFNLAVLCQACHLSVQARVDFYRPYFLPHTPWMARHVEAFNVWAAEHGRPALPNALGQPRLALDAAGGEGDA
ncbi:MAG: hypothetical protein KGK07_15645 [Chloroflexota bacterium]|nr:hypothetical protein [Chloroflexota bacterium]